MAGYRMWAGVMGSKSGLWIRTQGRERAPVDDSLNLNDRVEGVDVERLASRQRHEMAFE